MDRLRKAKCDTFYKWSLRRQVYKMRIDGSRPTWKDWKGCLTFTRVGRKAVFEHGREKGKFHELFLDAEWSIQVIRTPSEMETLMVTDGCWTVEHGLWDGQRRNAPTWP